MSSATKTLELLTYFTTAHPEIGLSQLCRLAERDKATTYRHLQALEDAGFVEQNPATKQYRLGPAVLQLAHKREATVPRKSAAKEPLHLLAEATGETAHASVLSGNTLFALASCESQEHATRAIVDITTYPLHATASGLCSLAFGPAGLIEVAMANLQPYTPKTAINPADLERAVQTTRDTGFATSERSYEDEIYSLSAPLFDHTGQFAGAVSLASVATRMTPKQHHNILKHLTLASHSISNSWGGTVPENLQSIWEKTLSQPSALETAS